MARLKRAGRDDLTVRRVRCGRVPCLDALFERGKLGAMWSAATETRGLRQREARLSGVLAAAG